MLKVSKLTDYATAVLLHLQKHSEKQSADEVSRALMLELPTVSKVLKLLTRARILQSVRGANGGYALMQDRNEVTLFDVISAIEGPAALTECSKEQSSCGQESTCDTREGWKQVNEDIKSILVNMTIQRMAELNGASQPDIPIMIRD